MARPSHSAATWPILAAATFLGLGGLTACDPPSPSPPDAGREPAAAPADPPSSPAPSPPPRKLAPGQPVELEMQAGDRERFGLELAAGDYVDLVVEQDGVDVILELLDPAGQEILAVDGLTGAFGPERIEWRAEAAGDHRVEIAVPPTARESGTCRVELRQRPATATDRARAAAAQAFFAGERARAARRFDEAVLHYGEAVERWRRLGDRGWQAVTLYHLGFVHRRLGYLESATYALQEALERIDDDPPLEAAIRNSLGFIYHARSEMESALENLLPAFALREELGDLSGRTTTAGNLGPTYYYLGEIPLALEFYKQALQGYRLLEDRTNEAKTLHNRGKLYLSQNRPQDALDELGQALEIRERLGNPAEIGSTKTGIAQGYILLEDFDQAQRYLVETLPFLEGVDKATALADLGWVHYLQGDYDEALGFYRRALEIYREAGKRAWVAYVLRRLGYLYAAQGDLEQALEHQRTSLRLCRQAGDRDCETGTLYGLAEAERQEGLLEEARQHLQQALDLIEELRTRSVGLEMRSTYMESKQEFYDLYVDLLMELDRRQPGAGHVSEALTMSERSRARSLLEALVEGGVDLESEQRPDLRQEERRLERAIHSRESRRAELRAKKAAPEALEQVDRELRRLLKQYRRVQDEIRQASPAYAALTQAHPASAAEIQRHVLDDETLLLEIDLGEKRSYLWAVDRDTIDAFELPGRGAIETLARRAYELATVSHKRRYRAVAARSLAELSELFLVPVAGRLEGKRRLLIVGEDVLQYVPFAALPRPGDDGPGSGTPLVESHEIVTMPSASALLVLDRRFAGRPPAPATLAVLADPVFSADDPRLTGTSVTGPEASTRGGPATRQLRRLPFSGQEADRILELVPPEQSFRALGLEASVETATSGHLGRHRIVHFATHGELNAEHPELSKLVLSRFDSKGRPRDGSLRLHQIYELDLPAELVVLSACQTALGREIRGEGLVGLTQGFMYAGAERVLVSLWNVDDRATAELMARFYRHLLRDDMAPAAALRAAQSSIRQERRWRAPYYWAGFVLQGSWRELDGAK